MFSAATALTTLSSRLPCRVKVLVDLGVQLVHVLVYGGFSVENLVTNEGSDGPHLLAQVHPAQGQCCFRYS